MFGLSSQSQFWATRTHEGHRSCLPGVSGSHPHSILPSASHVQCPQSLGELLPLVCAFC